MELDFNWINVRQCYCYNSNCPSRTEEKPYPYGCLSMNGEKVDCCYCGEEMTIVANTSDII